MLRTYKIAPLLIAAAGRLCHARVPGNYRPGSLFHQARNPLEFRLASIRFHLEHVFRVVPKLDTILII